MIGTSDGKQYNSELDYLMGNEQVAQSDSAGPVTKNKDPAPSGYESMRPSTNVEDTRNESGFDKFTQQMKDQLSRFQEDPMKFIMHGQAGWHNAQPMLSEQGQDYGESAGRMIQHNQIQPSFDDPSQNAPVSPLQPRTAVIIRHGDTSYTEADKAHGWSQEPLTDKGAEEVWKYADLKDKPDMLVTSDLPRTAETAAIVSEKTGVPVAEQHQGLRTWDIGDLQGKPCPEADKELEKYVGNPDKPVPGGESFNDFKSRVLGSFKDVLDRYPDQKVGFVTHSKVQKLLDAYDSTGGQYVDHDEYLTKPESPGKEKTMQLAMNDNFGISSHPVLQMDAGSPLLDAAGGAGKKEPGLLLEKLSASPRLMTYHVKVGEESAGTLIFRKMGEGDYHLSSALGNGPNSLGPTVVRQAFREFIKENPDAKYISATRVTGARRASGSTANIQFKVTDDGNLKLLSDEERLNWIYNRRANMLASRTTQEPTEDIPRN